MGWMFAFECFFFALVAWIYHYPPQDGKPFLRGGDASPPLTIIAICAFYLAVISTLGIAWWTIRKDKTYSRLWGIAASIATLFVYVDPSYWYQIQRKGVWVHWAVCSIGLIAFLSPQSASTRTDAGRGRLDDRIPNAGRCYTRGIVFPLVYLLTRRRSNQDAFLRFHCIQCLTLYALGALCILANRRWGLLVTEVALLATVVCYFVAIFNATNHRRFRLPLISPFAEWLSQLNSDEPEVRSQ